MKSFSSNSTRSVEIFSPSLVARSALKVIDFFLVRFWVRCTLSPAQIGRSSVFAAFSARMKRFSHQSFLCAQVNRKSPGVTNLRSRFHTCMLIRRPQYLGDNLSG